ncbi:NUDIX hydrolase [Levilactobacillus fujinensis]|uniref:NUDIX hydrolase n=1 Tax=Levilactobacillus fujinensis TaxID=2486024 RepID=A0ABW1TJ16_9LACO|nr:NUDIX hydrolase [Levilactobacillus fujinensis]
MADYIQELRKKVGNSPVILTFAGGILVDHRHRILLQKRSDFNRWGLPGGALEFGESAQEACVREFKEETGLMVAITGLLGISSNQIQRYPNGDIAQAVVVTFAVERLGGHLRPDYDETLALTYFSAAELPPMLNAQHEDAVQNFFSGSYPWYD